MASDWRNEQKARRAEFFSSLPAGGIFSVALSVKPALIRTFPAVSRHAALRRPDFPPVKTGDCPSGKLLQFNYLIPSCQPNKCFRKRWSRTRGRGSHSTACCHFARFTKTGDIPAVCCFIHIDALYLFDLKELDCNLKTRLVDASSPPSQWSTYNFVLKRIATPIAASERSSFMRD